MAEHPSFEALAVEGRMAGVTALERARQQSALEPGLSPLRSYERSIPGDNDQAYALFNVATCAAAREGDLLRSLNAFCTDEAAGTPWRDAFRHALGLNV